MCAAIRAQMVGVNDRHCPNLRGHRSWFGASKATRACRAQERAVYISRSSWRGCDPGTTTGSQVSPTRLRYLSLGGFEGKPSSDADRARPPVAGRRCLFRPHCSLAARTGLGALRPDRSHRSRTRGQRAPCRRIRAPRRPCQRGDRAAAWSTDHVGTPYGCRPRRQRFIDRGSRRCGSVPSCQVGYRRRAAYIYRRASRSKGHRPASASR